MLVLVSLCPVGVLSVQRPRAEASPEDSRGEGLRWTACPQQDCNGQSPQSGGYCLRPFRSCFFAGLVGRRLPMAVLS